MTFQIVLRKFYEPFLVEEMQFSRLLSNLIEEKLKYCPYCVKERGYYRLIWQVREVNICIEHRIKLIENCPGCNNSIPILAKDSEIGICPVCYGSLTDTDSSIPIKEEFNRQGRVITDWKYLLNSVTTFIPMINELNAKEAIAMALLYIFGDKAPVYDKNLLSSSVIKQKSIPGLLQSARGTRYHPSFVHLSTILTIIRLKNMSCKDFSQLNIPRLFVESVRSPKKPLYQRLSCKAPWCEYFNKKGSLQRTATSKKVTSNGRHLKYYLQCCGCLSEYAVDPLTGELIERGYFISLGWYKVRRLLVEGESIKRIEKSLKAPVDKVLRCTMYLVANDLLPEKILLKYKPVVPDLSAPKTIIDSISEGISIKKLWQSRKWSYREFLYYWFLPEVRLAWLSNVRECPERRGDLAERRRLVAAALKELDSKGEQVTISKVCGVLGINQETLRLWGFLPIVKEYKLGKNETEHYQREVEYIRKADTAIEKLRLENHVVLSELVYKELGVRRTVLVRNYPSVTAYIHQRLKEIRKEAQSKKLSQYIDATKSAVAFRLSEGLPVRQEDIAYDIGLSLSGFQTYPILKQICNEVLHG